MSLDAKERSTKEEGRTIEYPWRKKFLEQEPLLVHEGDLSAIKSSLVHTHICIFCLQPFSNPKGTYKSIKLSYFLHLHA